MAQLNYTTDFTIDEAITEIVAESLHGLIVTNPNTSVAYLQVFINADLSANITVGTDNPTFAPIAIPPQDTKFVPMPFKVGTNELGLAGTTTPTGNTGPTSDLLVTVLRD